MEKNSEEGLIQTVELAHDCGMKTSNRMEELYRLYIERRKNKKAREAFKRPAYQGTELEVGRNRK